MFFVASRDFPRDDHIAPWLCLPRGVTLGRTFGYAFAQAVTAQLPEGLKCLIFVTDLGPRLDHVPWPARDVASYSTYIQW